MSSRNLGSVLRKKMASCYKGLIVWHRAVRGARITGRNTDSSVFLILSSDNESYNYFGLLYLHSYMVAYKKKRAVVVGYDRTALSVAKLFSDKIVKVVELTRSEIDSLIDLYTLYDFRKNIIIADLDRPNGRNGRALLGKRDITIEDMIAVGVYRLYPVRRPSPPMYKGDDTAVAAFMTTGDREPYIPESATRKS